ncbi:hypothetical protein BH23GEM9_BH23GEM9_24330 [soil metagenome]
MMSSLLRPALLAASVFAGALVPSTASARQQPTPARTEQPTHAQIDAVFARYDRIDSPGCALGVISDGELVYQRGYGMANLDYGIANAPSMTYYVGSVSKQFTAAAIALLADEGRISIDDDVRRYIPELQDYGRPITIRHLVHHTSGLRDIYTLMSLAGIRMADVMTNADALALITRQRELNFPPGDDYLYTNSGYWLLGQIIERVTGETLRQYAHRRIFEPLGMTNTHFHDDAASIIPNRVVSYEGDENSGFRISYLANFDKVGAGGLYTTLADLAKWDANFTAPRIGGPDFLPALQTRGVLNRGDTLSYAFGINVQQRRGLDVVRHSGSLMGFRADMVRYPAERFSAVVLCNLGSIDAAALADRVTELYLGQRFQPEAQTTQAAQAAQAARAGRGEIEVPPPFVPTDFTGNFHSLELDVTYTIAARDDGLLLTRRLAGTQSLRPSGADRFTVGSQVFTFRRNAAGRVTGFTVEAGRVRNINFERVP